MHFMSLGRESQEKIQLAMDAMLGVREALRDPDAHPFRGIRDAYAWITGDRDVTFRQGGFARVSEAVVTADFPNILLNSMTKKLIQDYAAIGMGGLERLYVTARLDNYMTQDRVRMGYLDDLPTVAETGLYDELTKPTDELITYAPAKRGGMLTISEETIRNDNLGEIATFVSRLARAGRRTLKQFITNLFINNPNYGPDSVSWFNAAHNNLGSNALSSAELDAREAILLTQTEKDSGAPLGLPLEWIMVPPGLKATAFQINNNDDGTNSWVARFGTRGPHPEGIIVNELLTDANDWYYGCWPAEAPFIEIGFLDGIEQPQIVISNMLTQGTMFTNDEIRYKVKFPFGGGILDYRPVGKSVVA